MHELTLSLYALYKSIRPPQSLSYLYHTAYRDLVITEKQLTDAQEYYGDVIWYRQTRAH